MVERLFLAVPQGCLRFVIMVFPDHTHLLFLIIPQPKIYQRVLLSTKNNCTLKHFSYINRCHGGTQGELCQGLRRVCDTLSHVEVCINGGNCINQGGSAACSCPIGM